MTKRTKILITIAVIILLSVMALFQFRNKIFSGFFSQGPRRPKKQIETTYEIGWWAYQNRLVVEQFTVDIVESRLNLFNNKSLLAYAIQGTLNGTKGWRPYLKAIHLSERYTNMGSDSMQGIIEITPIVGMKEDNRYAGDTISYNVKNELMIESYSWGPNDLLFKCLSVERKIELLQRK